MGVWGMAECNFAGRSLPMRDIDARYVNPDQRSTVMPAKAP
ncbi:hypothetical protein [Sphingomonas faeni]